MFQITPPLRCITFGPDRWLNPIRPVLLGKDGGESGSAELVVLRVFAGGRIYLAALVDQRNRVVEWLEVWVQCTHDLDSSPLARSGSISNAVHDRQWRDAAEAMRGLETGTFLETDWETKSLTPLVVDLTQLTVVPLVQTTSKNLLELCRDDTVLKAAGLGLYSSTLERWFFAKSAQGELSWFSLQDLQQPGAGVRIAIPESGAEIPVTEFNLGAGLMLLCRHHPVSLEGLLQWLAAPTPGDDAKPAPGYSSPVEREILASCRRRPGAEEIPSADSVMEDIFIRVQLWLEMAREVHTLSAGRKSPFLNLSADSFRISTRSPIPLPPSTSPFHPVVVQPGDAIAIKVGESEAGFAPLRGTLASTHALPKFGGWLEGSGTLRIRQVTDVGEGRVRLEGVLDGNELKNAAAGNFVWVQTLVDGRSISFYAKTEADKGSNRAGMGFTVPSMELAAQAANRLKAAARHPCQFVILRPVDPRFDVYSLGVIGVRIFLTDDPLTVNELVDDLFELAAILPPRAALDDLRRLVGTTDLSDRLRRLLTPPVWAKDNPADYSLPGGVWLNVVRELLEFVTVEIPPEGSQGDAWLEVLAERLASLEQLSGQIIRLRCAPRPDHDEVARIVHSFI